MHRCWKVNNWARWLNHCNLVVKFSCFQTVHIYDVTLCTILQLWPNIISQSNPLLKLADALLALLLWVFDRSKNLWQRSRYIMTFRWSCEANQSSLWLEHCHCINNRQQEVQMLVTSGYAMSMSGLGKSLTDDDWLQYNSVPGLRFTHCSIRQIVPTLIDQSGYSYITPFMITRYDS